METVQAIRITTHVQKTVTPLVSVTMAMLQIALMMIAVQSHGLATDLKIVKIRRMAVI